MKDIIISGPPASGKTWIASAIAKTHYDGNGVSFLARAQFIEQVKRDNAESVGSIHDLVIIDECREEDMLPFFEVIKDRRASFVLLTNAMVDLTDHYGSYQVINCRNLHGPKRPCKIVLCGSTRFKDEFNALNAILSLQGNLVYSVAIFGHAGDFVLSAEEKERLDDVHKGKIMESDSIMVVDVDGYVGESTASEIEFAARRGTPIEYLSKSPSLQAEIKQLLK